MSTKPEKPATIPQALLLAFLTADPRYAIRCYDDYRLAEFYQGDEKLPITAPNVAALKSCADRGWITLVGPGPEAGPGTAADQRVAALTGFRVGTWERGHVEITDAGRTALVAAVRVHGAAFVDEERRFRTALACTLAARDEQLARAALKHRNLELGAGLAALEPGMRAQVRRAIASLPGLSPEIGALLTQQAEAVDAHRAAETARERACSAPAPARTFDA